MDAERAPVVCAMRGGEASRAVQARGIALARAEARALVFLYVVDVDVLERTSPAGGRALRAALRNELRWLGEVLLRLAARRARRGGVEAEIALREGRVAEQIQACLAARDAGLLLLGAPRGTTANVFGDDAIERFADRIARESGTEVRIVRPEEGVIEPL